MLLLLTAALAMTVEVLPDPPPTTVGRGAVTVAGTLPVTRAAITVDGLRDPAWATAPRGPDLLPWLDGGVPPEVEVRAAETPEALVVRLDPLPDDHAADLYVDPDGSSLALWHLALVGDVATLEVCTLPTWEEARWPVAFKTYPCEPLTPSGPVAARGDGGAELAIPWADLHPATTRMTVLVTVSGPGRAGGTWASNGADSPWPAAGRRVDRPVGGNSWVRVDAASGEWIVNLRQTLPGSSRWWTWRRRRLGTVVDEGVFDTRAGTSVRLPPLVGGVVVLREKVRDPIATGFTLTVAEVTTSLALSTPVWTDAVLLQYETNGTPTVTLVMTDDAGAELGRQTLTLPRGAGQLRVTPPAGAPDLVWLEADPGLPPVRALRLGP